MADLNVMNNEEKKELIETAAETVVEEAKKRSFDLVSYLEGSATVAALVVVGSYVKKKVTAGTGELKEEITEKTREAKLKKLDKKQAKIDAEREALLSEPVDDTEEVEE